MENSTRVNLLEWSQNNSARATLVHLLWALISRDVIVWETSRDPFFTVVHPTEGNIGSGPNIACAISDAITSTFRNLETSNTQRGIVLKSLQESFRLLESVK